VLLLAVIGAWLSHTAVYLHTRGTAGLRTELLAAPHVYMGPAAGVILAAAGTAAGRWWQLWSDLGGRLARVRAAIDSARRGHRSIAPPPHRRPMACVRSHGLLSLWPAVTLLQLTIYVLQENLEAVWVHQASPGLAVLWSDHWLATAVHLVTAFLLCALALLLRRGVTRRERALLLRERVLRWLLRAPLLQAGAARSALLPSPVDRFGRELWSRPPPPLPIRQ
jgi:hypothetical protein